MSGPSFARVLFDEIEAYDADCAVVLAHIRFRCDSDGPGRFVIDGVRWWRVSIADLAREVRMSRDAVKRTLKRLGNAVAANHFPPKSDRTLAYHVPPCGTALTCQDAESHRPDLPGGDSAPPSGGIAPTSGRNRTKVGAESPYVPISGDLEEGGRSGRVGATTRAQTGGDAVPATSGSATPDPFDYPDDPPEDDLHPFVEAAPAAAEPPPEPPRRCPKHLDWDTATRGSVPNCRPCGDAREKHERWQATAARIERAAEETAKEARGAALADCRDCDHGWVIDEHGKPVEPARRCKHPNLRQVRVS